MERAPREWPWVAAAAVGTIALAVGLWLLLGPMHTALGESCGSAFRMRFPPNDDPAVYFCGQQQGWRLADGWPLAALGGVAAAVAAARLAVLRRDRWLWA